MMTCLIIIGATLAYFLIGVGLAIVSETKEGSDRAALVAFWPVVLFVTLIFVPVQGVNAFIDRAQAKFSAWKDKIP